MNYWLNVHNPRIPDKPLDEQLQINIQEKCRQTIPVGDWVFIYETGALSGELVDSEENGRFKKVKVGNGIKGIIALVETTSSMIEKDSSWNGTPYKGYYETSKIPTRKNELPIIEIKKAYKMNGISKTFNPRTANGLMKLKSYEAIVLLSLIGVMD
jgi:hypothetical protein